MVLRKSAFALSALSALAFGVMVGAESNAISAVFANGCYWGRQYLFAHDLELVALKRKPSEVTAITGYFGGDTTTKKACYDNKENEDVYVGLNHSEAVKVELSNADELSQALELYFSSFIELAPKVYGREDYFDRGKQFRAIVGVPGGVKGVFFPLIAQANKNGMKLVDGDAVTAQEDTLGKNMVYVTDSEKGRFYQAELCLQFHNNQTSHYPQAYHDLEKALFSDGRLRDTGCPVPFPCSK